MKIITTPNPFLNKKAKKIDKITPKLQKDIEEMKKTLDHSHDPEGVGLAATQVGLDYALFIIKVKGVHHVFINPVLKNLSSAMLSDVYPKEKNRWLEGCLSVPKLWGFVDRHYSLDVVYQTPNGITLETKEAHFEDDLASYIQHEYDHLEGILFTDRILAQKGQIMIETKDGLKPFN